MRIANCGNDPALTFKQPSNVEIEGKTAKLLQTPNEFTSPDSRTNAIITLEPGNEPEDVVSFKLVAGFDESDDLFVCVTEITPAENLIVE